MPDLTPDEFRERAAAAVEWVAAYRAGLPDQPVQPDVVPGSVRAAFPTALPEAPEYANDDSRYSCEFRVRLYDNRRYRAEVFVSTL